MSRSALGRGLGSLFAENEARAVPVPGSGVGRLMKPRLAPADVEPTSVAPLPLARQVIPAGPVVLAATVSNNRAGRGLRAGLWLADVTVVGLGFWLGGLSPLAGSVSGGVAGSVLVLVGAFLGLLAAGVLANRVR